MGLPRRAVDSTCAGLVPRQVAGIFLFLTYSPVKSGLAFLPMIAAIVVASTTCSGVLMPRVGPRPPGGQAGESPRSGDDCSPAWS
jgi:hypothetical protein